LIPEYLGHAPAMALRQNTERGSTRLLVVWWSRGFYLAPHPTTPTSELTAHLPGTTVSLTIRPKVSLTFMFCQATSLPPYPLLKPVSKQYLAREYLLCQVSVYSRRKYRMWASRGLLPERQPKLRMRA
jgi:hypothetical protein